MKGKRKIRFTAAAVLMAGALIVTGCEGNLRDKNEAARGMKEAALSPVKAPENAATTTDTQAQQIQDQVLEEPSVVEEKKDIAPEFSAAEIEAEAKEPVMEQTSAPEVLPKYQELLQINPYVAGWLKIDDTVIDAPVVYTPGSQNYFLHRAIDGSDASAGTLFIAINWQEKNNQTLIYGHNMKDGTAFGSLLRFADEAYGRSHHLLHFDTLYAEDEYELYGVFYSQIDEEELETEEDRAQADQNIAENGIAKKAEAGVEVQADELTLFDIDLNRDFGDADIFRQEKDEDNGRFRYYYFTDLSDPADFAYFAENVKERALYDMGIDAAWGDKFIMLSTCSYQVTNGRFVVVGIKKQ